MCDSLDFELVDVPVSTTTMASLSIADERKTSEPRAISRTFSVLSIDGYGSEEEEGKKDGLGLPAAPIPPTLSTFDGPSSPPLLPVLSSPSSGVGSLGPAKPPACAASSSNTSSTLASALSAQQEAEKWERKLLMAQIKCEQQELRLGQLNTECAMAEGRLQELKREKEQQQQQATLARPFLSPISPFHRLNNALNSTAPPKQHPQVKINFVVDMSSSSKSNVASQPVFLGKHRFCLAGVMLNGVLKMRVLCQLCVKPRSDPTSILGPNWSCKTDIALSVHGYNLADYRDEHICVIATAKCATGKCYLAQKVDFSEKHTSGIRQHPIVVHKGEHRWLAPLVTVSASISILE